MHKAIIGGLMAFGMLAGCGGPETGADPVDTPPTEERTVHAAFCEPCYTQKMACLRDVQDGAVDEVQACMDAYIACSQATCP